MVKYLVIFIILYFFLKFKRKTFETDFSVTPSQEYETVNRWASIAGKYAYQYHIPRKIVLGIIYVESRGNKYAEGAIGESGLMQLTKNALIDIDMQTYNMFNPELNIEAGVRYLSLLNGKTNNLNLAIQSYNAGYSRVSNNPEAGKTYLNKVLKASESFT